jgi:hypothetical protein
MLAVLLGGADGDQNRVVILKILLDLWASEFV